MTNGDVDKIAMDGDVDKIVTNIDKQRQSVTNNDYDKR
jgi:hypothetical protein